MLGNKLFDALVSEQNRNFGGIPRAFNTKDRASAKHRVAHAGSLAVGVAILHVAHVFVIGKCIKTGAQLMSGRLGFAEGAGAIHKLRAPLNQTHRLGEVRRDFV